MGMSPKENRENPWEILEVMMLIFTISDGSFIRMQRASKSFKLVHV